MLSSIKKLLKKWFSTNSEFSSNNTEPEDFSTTRTSFCFLKISREHRRSYVLVPDNLNIEEHIKRYPLVNYMFTEKGGTIYAKNNNGTIGMKYDIDGLLHILDLITLIPAQNKDSISDDGYVSINSKFIRNYLKDYLSYLNYWIRTGVIVEKPGGYIPQVESLKYKFSSTYEVGSYNKVYYQIRGTLPIEPKVFNKVTKRKEANPVLGYSYLTHWYYRKGIGFDKPLAFNYAQLVLQKKLESGSQSWDTNDEGEKKNPRTQYGAIINNLTALEEHEYKVSIDFTGHRLHSVLTNMQKDYRNFLTFNGEELVSIDIKNSQPYIACLLLNQHFWTEDSTLPIHLTSLPEDIRQRIPSTTLLEIRRFFREVDEAVFNGYIEVVSSGNMYEIIMNKCSEKLHLKIERSEAKDLMFHLLFSSNQGQHPNTTINGMKKIFRTEMYPEVAKLLSIIKKKDRTKDEHKQHSRLAVLLQAIESHIILHRCCKRIFEEGNHEVPVFTIHDSIATTSEHVEYVTTVMREELEQCIGVLPSLEAEGWNIINLQHQDIYNIIVQE